MNTFIQKNLLQLNSNCFISVNYLNYGPFSSHAPLYDSSFSNVSKAESDLLLSTYGDESGAQYAQRLVSLYSESFIFKCSSTKINFCLYNWFSNSITVKLLPAYSILFSLTS